jgi:hypothetical protein
MRTILGLLAAGGILLGTAADSKAQVTVNLGGGGYSPNVSFGQPYGYGYGNTGYGNTGYGYGGWNRGYAAPYGYGPAYTTTTTRTYAYPGTTTYYSSGYRGYANPGYGYGSNNGWNRGYGYNNAYGYNGYSQGVNIYPSRGGVTVTTPAGPYRIGR